MASSTFSATPSPLNHAVCISNMASEQTTLRDSGLLAVADKKEREFLTKWMNDKLQHSGKKPYDDCVDALADGIGFAYLLEVIHPTPSSPHPWLQQAAQRISE